MINYRNELNQEQYEAVTATDGPVLILAGAGTGKTRTLVYRVAYLIEQGVLPEQILLLTFTNKAADEMMIRVRERIGECSSRVMACTYHSFYAKMLRQYAEKAHLDPNFTIIAGNDETDIIDMVKSSLNYHQRRGFPKSSLIAGLSSAMINMEKSLEEVLREKQPRYCCFENEIRDVITNARNYKYENAMLGYDDIMECFVKLLREHPDVRQEIASMYTHIMVDEYQDSNKIQDESLALLRQENHNLCVVGDDMQSLYQFRGADVQNILSFPERYAGTKVIKLVENYRSTQEILDVANTVSRQATEGIPKKLTSQGRHGMMPLLYRVRNVEEEAEEVLSLIMEKRESVPDSEICVLSRNSYQTYQLETKLTSRKIPFKKYGGQKFLEREHVKDILAYMRIYSNPRDEISWYRILQLHEGIGKIYSREIASGCKDVGAFHLLDPKYKRKQYYKELCTLYQELTTMTSMEFHRALKNAVDFYLDLKERTYKNMKVQDESTRTELLESLPKMKNDLSILMEIAASYDVVTSFLDDLTLEKTRPGQEETGITLSTIHSAKGLEFQIVIILDCVDQVFPSTTREDAGNKEDNEELRCFYVAATRAKTELYFFAPNVVVKFGRTLYTVKSHFLKEAPIQEEIL